MPFSLREAIIHRHQKALLQPPPCRRTFYPAAAILSGLLISQIIATLQVYLSNRSLHDSLRAFVTAGYLAVPNRQITDRLNELAPAIFGGLFFTLSVGTGISLLSFAAAWVWGRLFSRSRGPLVFLILLWAASIAAVTWRGSSLLTTAYFAVIPPLVFWITVRWMPRQRQGTSPWHPALIHLMTIALLASLWAPRMNGDLFLDLRDRLLLSNTLGTKINDFYYRYTLYPAEVFKSLDQKLLKAASLNDVGKKPLKKLLTEKLLNHDYLPIEGKGPVDLEISASGRDLIFQNRGRVILKTTPNDFLSSPGHILKQFSSKTDRNFLFRQFTYYSLLLGFPVTLYLFLHTMLYVPLARYVDQGTASVTAAIFCCLAGVSMLIPLWIVHEQPIEKDHVHRWLTSDRWQERVAALKSVRQNGLDVSGVPSYRGMLSSPHIPERYWLAKALSVSRSDETHEDLLRLLDDPSPSVACMAFQSLGRRGNRDAVTDILKRIEASDHWYTQWYAYRALKAIGWKHIESR